MGSGIMIYIPSFMKIGSHTERQQGDFMSVLLRLKMGYRTRMVNYRRGPDRT
jgi:hypothetical protein